MPKVMVLGGMRGLGREISVHSLARGHDTVALGRSIERARRDDGLSRARLIKFDLDELTEATELGGEPHMGEVLDEARDTDVLFLVSGIWLRKPVAGYEWGEIARLAHIHYVAPTMLLSWILRDRDRPLHVAVVSSTSAWKRRNDGQAAYGFVQAGKAQFAFNLAAELQRSLPGSTVTLACPGGMNTELFEGSGIDTSDFMDAGLVANHVWNAVEAVPHVDGFLEMHVEGRGADVTVSYGPRVRA